MQIEIVSTPEAPRPLANYSQGAAHGDLVFLAGQIASDYRTGVPDAARRAVRLRGGSDIGEQTRYVLDNIAAVAEAGGASLDTVAKAHVFLRSAADLQGMDRAWREVFADPPPRTTVVVGGHGLLVPGTLVEIDLWAAARGAEQVTTLEGGTTAPLASYAAARRQGPLVHCAGRMALAPDGAVAPAARVDPAFPFYADAVERQTRFVLDEFRALMRGWGGDLDDTVFAQVYLEDLADADLFEETWRASFPDPPARVLLQAGALLGEGARVEIELTAVHPDHRADVRRHELAGIPRPAGAPHAVQVGPYLLLSGIDGIDTAGAAGPSSSYLLRPVTAQTETAVERLAQILDAVGSDLDHIVRTQCFLADLEDFSRYDRVWKRRLRVVPPRTTVQVGPQGFLDPRARLELGVVAVTR